MTGISRRNAFAAAGAAPFGLAAFMGSAAAAEKTAAEKAFKRNEEIYRLITENTRDFITIVDPKGEFLYVSPSCKILLGYEPDDLVGTDSFSLIHPDDIKTLIDAFQEATPRRGRVVEFRYRHRNGE